MAIKYFLVVLSVLVLQYSGVESVETENLKQNQTSDVIFDVFTVEVVDNFLPVQIKPGEEYHVKTNSRIRATLKVVVNQTVKSYKAVLFNDKTVIGNYELKQKFEPEIGSDGYKTWIFEHEGNFKKGKPVVVTQSVVTVVTNVGTFTKKIDGPFTFIVYCGREPCPAE